MTAEVSAGATSPAPVPRRRRRERVMVVVGLVLLVVGLVAFAAGAQAVSYERVASSTGTASFAGLATLPLRADVPYVLLEERVYSVGLGRLRPPQMRPADVTITGPGGATVPLRAVDPVAQPGPQDRRVPVATFEVPVDGNYTVTNALTEANFSVARTDGFQLSPGAGATVRQVAWASVVLGSWLLVVGTLVPARRRRRAESAAIPRPAGWYADPEQPGTWRWWDGARWTDHRA